VIATLLRELVSAGVPDVTVVVGHLGEQVERLLEGFGPGLRFVQQPEPLGSADAVLRAGLEAPYLVVAADTVFTPGDVGRFLSAAEGYDGALSARRHPPPDPPHRFPLRIEGGLVTRVLDDDRANPLANAPLFAVGAAVARQLQGLTGPPYELAQAVQRAIDAGARVAGVEIGPTRDLTFPLDLVRENFDYTRTL
jgi:NDP-sugar pyrophosphorylase family protein